MERHIRYRHIVSGCSCRGRMNDSHLKGSKTHDRRWFSDSSRNQCLSPVWISISVTLISEVWRFPSSEIIFILASRRLNIQGQIRSVHLSTWIFNDFARSFARSRGLVTPRSHGCCFQSNLSEPFACNDRRSLSSWRLQKNVADALFSWFSRKNAIPLCFF